MKIITDKGNVFTIEKSDFGAVLTTSETLDQEKADDMTAAYDVLKGFKGACKQGYAGPINGIYYVQNSATKQEICPSCGGKGVSQYSALSTDVACSEFGRAGWIQNKR